MFLTRYGWFGLVDMVDRWLWEVPGRLMIGAWK